MRERPVESDNVFYASHRTICADEDVNFAPREEKLVKFNVYPQPLDEPALFTPREIKGAKSFKIFETL